MINNYAMRKIPFVEKEIQNSFEIFENDKIKILEISNMIDKWEKELLFSANGFFSLKGKDVENKTEEFLTELEKFILLNIEKIKLKDEKSRYLLLKIKNEKISAIKQEMQNYEKQQLNNWKLEVFENGIKSCIQRAILYKNNSKILQTSYFDAFSILEMISKIENWDLKTLKQKKEQFENDFYYELINSFLLEKDAKASFYFEKYKDKLTLIQQQELESAIKNIKNIAIAYNWAKELFSYDLSDFENEKEIKQLKDIEIKALIKKYLQIFKQEKKKNEEQLKIDKNIKNWNELISLTKTDLNKAELYIDFSLDEDSVKAKKDYIKTIRKDGFIKSNKKLFLDLLAKIVENNKKFKQEDISNYHKELSSQDFTIIEKLRSLSEQEFDLYVSDFNYINSQLKAKSIENVDEIYSFVKTILSVKDNYLSIKKEEPDLEKRNKLIEVLLVRYLNK